MTRHHGNCGGKRGPDGSGSPLTNGSGQDPTSGTVTVAATTGRSPATGSLRTCASGPGSPAAGGGGFRRPMQTAGGRSSTGKVMAHHLRVMTRTCVSGGGFLCSCRTAASIVCPTPTRSRLAAGRFAAGIATANGTWPVTARGRARRGTDQVAPALPRRTASSGRGVRQTVREHRLDPRLAALHQQTARLGDGRGVQHRKIGILCRRGTRMSGLGRPPASFKGTVPLMRLNPAFATTSRQQWLTTPGRSPPLMPLASCAPLEKPKKAHSTSPPSTQRTF
jgi:hypothetical protein